VNEIIQQNFGQRPNFLSIDIEGLDLDILKSLNFEQYGPDVVCVETVGFGAEDARSKANETREFMSSKNYFAFADTHVNTIFCHIDEYKKKR